ncbi:hypothetical protein [Gimesia maris]|uniref:hypothetical protein n=1 Tax=Gimesia maris TaxID=122 RepID=UPI0030D937FB|tara:strand:+ start:214 stop:870 length:657 start_codon:yes stop_codon:yes gene_type:complete
MATTATSSRNRRARQLKHQHQRTPFKTKADLQILEDYDMKRFRRHLKSKVTFPVYVKIEQTNEDVRPHFHFIATESITKNTFRTLILNCLQGEKIDLKVEEVDEDRIEVLCSYTAKNTQYVGRCTFTLGKFWTESPAELGKLTDSERVTILKNSILYEDSSTARRLSDYFFMGIIPEDELSKPSFLPLWRNYLECDSHYAQVYEIAMMDTGWNHTQAL